MINLTFDQKLTQNGSSQNVSDLNQETHAGMIQVIQNLDSSVEKNYFLEFCFWKRDSSQQMT